MTTIRRSLLIAQFPGGGTTAWQTARYVARLAAQLEHDERIGRVEMWDKNDTPITMTRNQALLVAEQQGVDYVLMIDSDMIPDLYHKGDPEAKPFFQSAFDFMLAHDGPCAVAAPYCGPPPHECVYVFHWTSRGNDNPNPDFALEMIPRTEAAKLRGIQRAAALPTGLILIDMRAVRKLPHPRFYYEWKDETESEKASTEDVAFTRDLTTVGVPVYCNWDAWAGHIKTKVVGKPELLPAAAVPRMLRKRASLCALEGEEVDDPNGKPRRLRPVNSFRSMPAAAPSSPVVIPGEPVRPEDEAPPEGGEDWLAPKIRLRPGTQDEVAYREVYDLNEYGLPERFDPTDVVIDVGAHVGCFALAALERGAGRVVCYEPAPDNCRALSANVGGWAGVEIYQAAIWRSDREESVKLVHRGPRATAMHRVEPAVEGDPAVPTVALDLVLKRFDEVRLLKVDCEGSEYPILLTSAELPRCREIAVECHKTSPEAEAKGCSAEGLVAHLCEWGFDAVIKPHPVCPEMLSYVFARRTPAEGMGACRNGEAVAAEG